MTLVYGIDPGKTSGIVVGSYDDNTPFTLINSYEIVGGAVEIGVHFEMVVSGSYGEWRIIAEGFEGQSHKFYVDPNWSVKPLGAIIYLAHKYDIPYHERRPGVPKAITNAILKRAGLYLKSKDDDNRSAMKHVLQQLMDEGHAPTMQLIREASL